MVKTVKAEREISILGKYAGEAFVTAVELLKHGY